MALLRSHCTTKTQALRRRLSCSPHRWVLSVGVSLALQLRELA